MKLRIMSIALEFITEIDAFESLIFERSLYGRGKFILALNNNVQGANELQIGRIIALDSERVGLIQYINIDDSSGSDKLNVQGVEMKGVLWHRLTIPPTGQAYHSFVDTAIETIFKTVVQRNCIDITEFAFSDFEIETDGATGDIATISTRYENLGEFLNQYGKAYLVGSKITADFQNKKFVYDIVTGIDRTAGQSVNNRVIFSKDYDNVQYERYTKNEMNSYNYIVTLGNGDGATRTRIDVSDTATGYVQKVALLDLNESADTVAITTNATSFLEANKPIENFENQIYTDKTMIYNADYKIGDFVTIKSKKGVSFDKQLEFVTEIYSNGIMKVNALFGDKNKGIKDIINNQNKTVVR
jgi:hypothetical protein